MAQAAAERGARWGRAWLACSSPQPVPAVVLQQLQPLLPPRHSGLPSRAGRAGGSAPISGSGGAEHTRGVSGRRCMHARAFPCCRACSTQCNTQMQLVRSHPKRNHMHTRGEQVQEQGADAAVHVQHQVGGLAEGGIWSSKRDGAVRLQRGKLGWRPGQAGEQGAAQERGASLGGGRAAGEGGHVGCRPRHHLLPPLLPRHHNWSQCPAQ